jgi:hypothetical protein
MYRNGLPRAPDRRAGRRFYLHGQLSPAPRAADPELRAAHEKATRSRARVTARGLEQLQQLLTMVHSHLCLAGGSYHPPSGFGFLAGALGWLIDTGTVRTIGAVKALFTAARCHSRRFVQGRGLCGRELAPALLHTLAVQPDPRGKPVRAWSRVPAISTVQICKRL